jgi:cytochrome c-type biogenesis protein CcmE
MGSRLCFVLVVFFFAATLILTVYLRDSRNRDFYTLRRCKIEQGRLQQELWQKQLRVESLINPASISRRLDKQGK